MRGVRAAFLFIVTNQCKARQGMMTKGGFFSYLVQFSSVIPDKPHTKCADILISLSTVERAGFWNKFR